MMVLNKGGMDMEKYMSGQQAMDEGLITEADWQSAIAHPWTWVILSGSLRIREIPWQGLELEVTNCEVGV